MKPPSLSTTEVTSIEGFHKTQSNRVILQCGLRNGGVAYISEFWVQLRSEDLVFSPLEWKDVSHLVEIPYGYGTGCSYRAWQGHHAQLIARVWLCSAPGGYSDGLGAYSWVEMDAYRQENAITRSRALELFCASMTWHEDLFFVLEMMKVEVNLILGPSATPGSVPSG
ncbi:hypothetical protein FLAG1_06258 [Fusarium langsethiae]|uniref:Uncharacterized protein n=1 Tax=Fusarium langsethiae TaxID=179993 RepID=A0A0M9EVW7_FUSLA|nr:hypothetical protein FLAG1_06258 [Fusarium langsethiae]GKU03670.1 unnamed protein product [Fusarium langsethiae]GKU20400.1 unnamed protein product [Fusarium langsethiae]